ncbi:hypothetical protein INR49_012319 [Caranx melampygus]|nr:hypothetical protein INR49_012319 [Caranx melampygus]
MTEETVRADPVRNVGPDEGVRPREKWANKREFILSMTGMLFSLENIARFPFVAYRDGAGPFFFAYCVCLFFIGMPMLFLETALGQYTSIGIASQVIVTYGNIYFIVMLSWVIFYLVNSFRSPLLWSTCENVWNTELCHSHVSVFANPHLFRTDANWSFLNNFTLSEDLAFTDYIARVLRMSDDISLGKVHWDLALCLLLAWVICYFCTWKGIRIMGKVVYVTATLPFILLVILFFRGVTLPGAAMGLKYCFMSHYRNLFNISLWIGAVYEVLYTHAVSLGVLTTLGSYNKYNNDCYRVEHAVRNFTQCFVNAACPIFLGCSLLLHDLPLGTRQPVSVHGEPCHSHYRPVPTLPEEASGREILVLVIAVVSFLLGLPLITNGGIYLFTLIDYSSNSHFSPLIIVGLEAVIISWTYGADRFYDNIEDMIGYKPFPVLKYCWMFIIPLVCWDAKNMTRSSRDLRQAQPYRPVLSLCKRVIFEGQQRPIKSVEEGNEKLMMEENYKLWIGAVSDVLYTHAVSLGVLTTLGSYNKYNNDCYRDCWALSCLMAVTNFVAGVTVFSMVGFMAHMRSMAINEVIDGGADCFYDNIEDMIRYKPFPVLKYCWMFIIPLVCWLMVIYFAQFVLNGRGSMIPNEAFHSGYNIMLALMLVSVLICIPAFMLVLLCKDAKNMTKSSKDLRQAWPFRPQRSLCKQVISMGQQRLIRSTEEGNQKLRMEENHSV